MLLRSLELELYQVKEICSEGRSCLSACPETDYWTLSRQVCNEEKPEEPIVFLHGIGIGLVDPSFCALGALFQGAQRGMRTRGYALAGMPTGPSRGMILNALYCFQGPYFFWVLDLVCIFSRHTIILVEYDHISLRLHSSKLLFDSTAHTLKEIVIRAGFSKVCIVGYTFGTFVALRLCKLHPEVCSSKLQDRSQNWNCINS